MTAALDASNEDGLLNGLEALIDLVTEVPRLFRSKASQTLTYVLQLVATRKGGVRALAVEFVVSFAEAAPATCRKARLEVNGVDACCGLLMEEDPSPEAWEISEEPEPDLDAECGRELGRDALDRLARALRPEALLPRAMVVAAQLLQRAPRGTGGRAGRVRRPRAARGHVGDRARRRRKKERAAPRRHADGVHQKTHRGSGEFPAPVREGRPAAVVRAAAWDALGQAAADLQPQLQDDHSSSSAGGAHVHRRRRGAAGPSVRRARPALLLGRVWL